MKKTFLIILTLTTIKAFAQKTFDSTAYVQFNQNRWEKVSFQDMMSDKGIKELTSEEKIAGLSKAWAEVKYNFANFDLVPNLNWDSLYTAYIPRVSATSTTIEYFKMLQNFYQPLRDGHTAISLPVSYLQNEWSGVLPIEIKWVENRAIVVKNNSENRADASIKPGMELIKWNGIDLQEHIKKNISPYLHFSTSQDSTERIYRYDLVMGKAGTTAALTFKTTGGKIVKQDVAYKSLQRFWEQYPLVNFKVLKGNVGYLQINSFGDEKVVQIFDSLFSKIAQTDALIIDVRNNGGGNGNNGFEILGSLTDKPFYTGKAVIRKYKSVGRAWGDPEAIDIESSDWKPYKKQLYSKPVVVLTSAATYSAAEDFTATFQSMNRGKVIGEPTGGSTGQPVMFTLPGGGTGRVCAKRDYYADGREFIGVGIMPDIPVQPTVKGIASEKDEVLEAGLTYVKRIR